MSFVVSSNVFLCLFACVLFFVCLLAHAHIDTLMTGSRGFWVLVLTSSRGTSPDITASYLLLSSLHYLFS